MEFVLAQLLIQLLQIVIFFEFFVELVKQILHLLRQILIVSVRILFVLRLFFGVFVSIVTLIFVSIVVIILVRLVVFVSVFVAGIGIVDARGASRSCSTKARVTR